MQYPRIIAICFRILSIKMSSFTTLLVGLLAIQETIGQDITCDDCIMVVGGLKDALLFNERYIQQVIVKLQAKDQELTLFYPCHNKNNKKNSNKKNPSPKSIRSGSARRLNWSLTLKTRSCSSLYSVVASLASEEESILNEICPGAGLGDQDDHPNCEK